MEVSKLEMKKRKGLGQIIAESLVAAFAIGYAVVILIVAPLAIGKYLGHGLGLASAVVNILIYSYFMIYKINNCQTRVLAIVGLVMLICFADLALRLDVEKSHDLWQKMFQPKLLMDNADNFQR